MVNLTVQKYADRSYLFLKSSNVIRYSVIISNTGDTEATCVTVKDMLSVGASIKCNTITVDACCVSNVYNPRGISIGKIPAGGNKIVTFEVEVDKKCPPSNILNKAIVSYCDQDNNTIVIESNVVNTPIINIEVCVKKIVSSISANVGDLLSYTIVITNNSNVPIDNVLLYDELQDNVTLLPGTVMVNGVIKYEDNLNGLDIGTINPKSSTILIFQVRIDSIESTNFIKNSANVKYLYSIMETEGINTSIGNSCSNQVITKVSEGNCLC